MADGLPRSYYVQDLTTAGIPPSQGVSFVSDEQAYRFSPARYGFYMQLLNTLQMPEGKNVVDQLISTENQTRYTREQLEKKAEAIIKDVRYMHSAFKGGAPQSGGEIPTNLMPYFNEIRKQNNLIQHNDKISAEIKGKINDQIKNLDDHDQSQNFLPQLVGKVLEELSKLTNDNNLLLDLQNATTEMKTKLSGKETDSRNPDDAVISKGPTSSTVETKADATDVQKMVNEVRALRRQYESKKNKQEFETNLIKFNTVTNDDFKEYIRRIKLGYDFTDEKRKSERPEVTNSVEYNNKLALANADLYEAQVLKDPNQIKIAEEKIKIIKYDHEIQGQILGKQNEPTENQEVIQNHIDQLYTKISISNTAIDLLKETNETKKTNLQITQDANTAKLNWLEAQATYLTDKSIEKKKQMDALEKIFNEKQSALNKTYSKEGNNIDNPAVNPSSPASTPSHTQPTPQPATPAASATQPVDVGAAQIQGAKKVLEPIIKSLQKVNADLDKIQPSSTTSNPSYSYNALDKSQVFQEAIKEIGNITTSITGSPLIKIGGAVEHNKFKDFFDKINSTTTYGDREEQVARYEEDPVLGPSTESLTITDRVVFIATTFVLRALALFVIQWGLNTYMLRSFNQAFMWYFIVYVGLFVLWVLLVNTVDKDLVFRMLFYYVAADPNGYGRMIAHLCVLVVFLPIPFLVKTKEQDPSAEEFTFEKRRSIFRLLSMLTFFIWVVTSAIAFQY